MITAHSLTKRYGEATAVDDLTFEVPSGEVTGFLGPNGSGKSTTMRMIMGLDLPDSGSALIDGKRYCELDWPLREVGALLDAKAFHPARTARNHLRWLALANDIPSGRVDEVLDQVGLTSVAKRRVGKFSLGMTQRLGIAAALLGDPGVLLFDEPVNGLDPEGIRWVRHFLRDLARRGPNGARVEPPHQRDVADRRPAGGDRSGAPDRRDERGRLRRPQRRRGSAPRHPGCGHVRRQSDRGRGHGCVRRRGADRRRSALPRRSATWPPVTGSGSTS